uniref:Small ribosomal subunit protein uS11c n=1 Tax=Hildenbrandia rubra TaxID=31481 RepID=A0A1C9CGB3_9FLOR|nr:ribosomal protein S11 [Hildenbrandia rubra]AOM67414.1 ribosomal protein S11 [Hildenbrandia rubra]|eukprot:Plantae.Rhodophyta-Hildenbrandia_rubra.ctg1082.p2 GENE.Plantae.Rhodophyta-Hildenbrandia_rubra.ctg1082~~Plantae.Rhodophyta-Hildenbrandia_rubra.ctg1082.p2  ORF type:complete len:131 (-),score=13.58 Plantae.Rhodophyta-Hildenbrandia_rubra.ctg1082:132-524(-)
MARKTQKSRIKKQKLSILNGITHIQSTFNNTIVTITNLKGETIAWSSAGCSGFKGTKKGTPFAAQQAAQEAANQVIEIGMQQTEILINGPGAGREPAIRALKATGLEITLIKDITPIPHNGCRPPKKRRI